MAAQFRNLVFEGGGVKGIAYVGAMQVLAERGLLNDIRRVGGTSAGAINALIFALGYDLAEQQGILRSTDFGKFMDDSFGFIRDVWRLTTKFGWHRGDFPRAPASASPGLVRDRHQSLHWLFRKFFGRAPPRYASGDRVADQHVHPAVLCCGAPRAA